MDQLHTLGLSDSAFSLEIQGIPALWLSGAVSKPSLQTLHVPVWNAACGSDMEKTKIWIYGGYHVNQSGFLEYLPAACINRSAAEWMQSRITFVFHVGNGKPDSNMRIVYFFNMCIL